MNSSQRNKAAIADAMKAPGAFGFDLLTLPSSPPPTTGTTQTHVFIPPTAPPPAPVYRPPVTEPTWVNGVPNWVTGLTVIAVGYAGWKMLYGEERKNPDEPRCEICGHVESHKFHGPVDARDKEGKKRSHAFQPARLP